MEDDEEEPGRSVKLRCPGCNYFLIETWNIDTGLFRLFCRNRQCRRQCWFIFSDGKIRQASLGEIAIGGLEKPVRP